MTVPEHTEKTAQSRYEPGVNPHKLERMLAMEMLSLKTCRADLLQRYLHARFVHIQMQQYAANAVRKISYVQQQFTAFSRQLTSLHAIVSCGHGTCYPQSYSIATSVKLYFNFP